MRGAVHTVPRPEEQVGRRSASGSRAVKAYKNRFNRHKPGIPVSAFEPPRGTNELSVDRLGLASDEEMVRIAVATFRVSGRKFYGWFVLSVGDVLSVGTDGRQGCSVVGSPREDNMYHADIVMPVPLDADDRKDAIREYARDLAYLAHFEPRGNWTRQIDER